MGGLFFLVEIRQRTRTHPNADARWASAVHRLDGERSIRFARGKAAIESYSLLTAQSAVFFFWAESRI